MMQRQSLGPKSSRHKQSAVTDLSTFHPALLDNEAGSRHHRDALTLVHDAASTAVNADRKHHLHMDQLDRAMGMAMIMCFLSFKMMQVSCMMT